jgi:hypothetical protein
MRGLWSGDEVPAADVVGAIVSRSRCGVFALPVDAASRAGLLPWSRSMASDNPPGAGDTRTWTRIEFMYVGPELGDQKFSVSVRSELPHAVPLPYSLRLVDIAGFMEGCLVNANLDLDEVLHGQPYRGGILSVADVERAAVETVRVAHSTGDDVTWEIRSITKPIPISYGAAVIGGTDVRAALSGSAPWSFAVLMAELIRLMPATAQVAQLEDALRTARTYFLTERLR